MLHYVISHGETQADILYPKGIWTYHVRNWKKEYVLLLSLSWHKLFSIPALIPQDCQFFKKKCHCKDKFPVLLPGLNAPLIFLPLLWEKARKPKEIYQVSEFAKKNQTKNQEIKINQCIKNQRNLMSVIITLWDGTRERWKLRDWQ